jgi:hypothetical protein
MGSQNVTNFSAAKAARIRDQLKEFNPQSPAAGVQASSAAAEAIGEFTKSNSFVQCLASESVENALKSVISLSNGFKYRDPNLIFEEYGVDPGSRRPLTEFAERLTRSLSESLTTTQNESDSTFAAKDALSRTLIDVVAKSVPREEAVSASSGQFAAALRGLPARDIGTLFFQNLISSLLRMSLDAARGRVPREEVEDVAERVREDLAARLGREIENLARGKGLKPTDIPAFIRGQVDKPQSLRRLEGVRLAGTPGFGAGRPRRRKKANGKTAEPAPKKNGAVKKQDDGKAGGTGKG